MNFKKDLVTVLSDEFIANVNEVREGIKIKFLNGSTYLIKIEKEA